MRTLIVYYSHSHNNAALATELQRRLGCDIFRIEDAGRRTRFTIMLDRIFNRTPGIKEYSLQLEKYDQFIFVAPVWASSVAMPLKTFLIRERSFINRYSFITVCGGKDGQLQMITTELTNFVHQEPEKVVELWISTLVPEDKKDDVKFMMDFKLSESDFERFSAVIDDFLARSVPAAAK
jgi:flavodoxin